MTDKQLKELIREEYHNVKSFMEEKYGFVPELGQVVDNPYVSAFKAEDYLEEAGWSKSALDKFNRKPMPGRYFISDENGNILEKGLKTNRSWVTYLHRHGKGSYGYLGGQKPKVVNIHDGKKNNEVVEQYYWVDKYGKGNYSIDIDNPTAGKHNTIDPKLVNYKEIEKQLGIKKESVNEGKYDDMLKDGYGHIHFVVKNLKIADELADKIEDKHLGDTDIYKDKGKSYLRVSLSVGYGGKEVSNIKKIEKIVGMRAKAGSPEIWAADDLDESILEYDVETIEETKDFINFMKEYKSDVNEAEYQGRDVKLGKIMQGDVKKFKVYVKNPKGNVVKVNFGHKGKGGEKTMRIKKSDPERRKAFRARHNCDNPGPRHKARYWACRTW